MKKTRLDLIKEASRRKLKKNKIEVNTRKEYENKNGSLEKIKGK